MACSTACGKRTGDRCTYNEDPPCSGREPCMILDERTITRHSTQSEMYVQRTQHGEGLCLVFKFCFQNSVFQIRFRNPNWNVSDLLPSLQALTQTLLSYVTQSSDSILSQNNSRYTMYPIVLLLGDMELSFLASTVVCTRSAY